MPPFHCKCEICGEEFNGDTINDAVLGLVHNPKCDAEKGVSWFPQVKDQAFAK